MCEEVVYRHHYMCRVRDCVYCREAIEAIQKDKVETNKTFYFNGQPMEEVESRGGKLRSYDGPVGVKHGRSTAWYHHGQKSSEGKYQDGKKQDTWTYWYEDGQESRQEEYQDGKQHGKVTCWHKNGKKKYECTYRKGKMHGTWTEWYENGQKEEEGKLHDGKETGTWTYWAQDGQAYSIRIPDVRI